MEDLLERWDLASQRVAEIAGETAGKTGWQDYFHRTAGFLKFAAETGQRWQAFTLEEKRERNRQLYEDILPSRYGHSYGNPSTEKNLSNGLKAVRKCLIRLIAWKNLSRFAQICI